MDLNKIAILSPGDMGAAVGAVLARGGLNVTAALDGRSERTRALAAQAGFMDACSLETLVESADMVLSILVPSEAERAARDVAAAMRATGRTPLYVDCNAIAAESTRRVGEIVSGAGAPFVDASIIGPPPRKPDVTRFYASGSHAHDFARLGGYGLDVRVLDGPVGQASSFKTCYASLTKGLQALALESLISARALGLHQALAEELRHSQSELYARMERSLHRTPPKAHRFVGEMEEHGRAFAAQGITPNIMQGAADLYRFIASTPLGRESPEERGERSLEEMMEVLAAALPGEGSSDNG